MLVFGKFVGAGFKFWNAEGFYRSRHKDQREDEQIESGRTGKYHIGETQPMAPPDQGVSRNQGQSVNQDAKTDDDEFVSQLKKPHHMPSIKCFIKIGRYVYAFKRIDKDFYRPVSPVKWRKRNYPHSKISTRKP
jgi:hypothetical protein